MTVDDDGAFRLLAVNDKGHRVPVEPGSNDLTDECFVLAPLVLKGDGVVDVCIPQPDQDLLVRRQERGRSRLDRGDVVLQPTRAHGATRHTRAGPVSVGVGGVYPFRVSVMRSLCSYLSDEAP